MPEKIIVFYKSEFLSGYIGLAVIYSKRDLRFYSRIKS